MITEEDADMFLLDEFDNDDTEDVSLIEVQEMKIKTEPLQTLMTVPTGWRYNTKSKKLISTIGEVFRSRRGALKAMVNSEHYSIEEIEEMRSMLRHEGWRESDDLPRCWLIRDGRKKNCSEFLGPGGEYFTTLGKAAMFIFNYEEYFYNEDLENFWNYANISGLKKEDFNTTDNNNKEGGEEVSVSKYLSRNSNVNTIKKKTLKTLPQDAFSENLKVNNDQEKDRVPNNAILYRNKWQSPDKSLPKGWMSKEFFRGSVKFLKFRAPTGEVLLGRRNLLKFIIKNNFPSDLVKTTKFSLMSEGWKENDNLPSQWMYKLHKGKYGSNLMFIDLYGNLYKSKEEVKRHFQQLQNFENLSKFNKFLKSRQKGSYYKAGQELDEGWLLGDPSVPSGWRIRKKFIGGSVPGEQLLTPDHRCLDGRRVALKFMVNNNYPKEEIKLMRNSLMTHNDWLEDTELPENWLYKCTKHGRKTNFIDSDGNLFKSQLEVLKFYKHKNDQQIVNLLKQYFNVPVVHHVENEEGWRKNDPFVPSGWSIKDRKDGNSCLLLSTEGFLFHGRKAALRYLIENNYPDEQTQEMRRSLTHEGWSFADGLPHNWLYRRDKKKSSYEFVSQDATYFKSSTAAIRYLEESNLTAEKEMLEKYCQQLQRKERIEDNSWTKDDSIVPRGWKTKEYKVGNSTLLRYISPDGHIFTTRTSALKFMFDNKDTFNDEEVKNMKLLIQKHEKWQSDPKLPKDWLYKRILKNALSISFISNEAVFFKSREAALNYLEENNKLNETILLKEFISNVERNDRVEDNHWNRNDQTVPPGWKTKEYKVGKSTLLKFISPDGHIFTSRTTALKFMFDNKDTFSDGEVTNMKDLLQKHDKWYSDPQLPTGWLYKSFKAKHRGISFITNEAVLLSSREAALKHLEENNMLKEKILLQGFILNVQRNDRIEDNSWNFNDQTVPSGWKTKIKQNGKLGSVLVLISPDGQLCMGRKKALKYMIENKNLFSDSEVEEMRSLLQLHDGWLANNDMPRNWLYKKERNDGLSFLDCFGNYYRSKEQLFVTLSKEKLDDLRNFLDSQGVSCLSQDAWVSNDPSLPPGWKIRKLEQEVQVPDKVKALLSSDKISSPNGHIFGGKAHAYRHMIRKKYPSEDLAIMRNGLLADGWFEDPALPQNWLAKRLKDTKCVKSSRFMDEKGNVLKSLVIASKFLTKQGRPEDVDKLKTFYGSRKNQHNPKKSEKDIDFNQWENSQEESLLGWKRKVDGSGREHFMSPSGDHLKGRFRLIKYLKDKNIDGKSVTILKEILGLNNRSNKFKSASVGKGQVLEENETGNSDSNILVSIESTARKRGIPKKVGWFRFKEEALSGWKYRIDESKTPGPGCYKSPSGDTFTGRLNVLKYMKETHFKEEAVLAMKKRFRQEDGYARKVQKRKTTVKTDLAIPAEQINDEALKISEGSRSKSTSERNNFQDESLAGWKYKSDKKSLSLPEP